MVAAVSSTAPDARRVVLGRINGLFGVRGWVKVYSWTRPRENLFEYPCWQLGNDQAGWRDVKVADWRPQGKGLVARLEGVEDRDAAASLIGQEIAVSRDELPPAGESSWYWADLIGLQVQTLEGQPLGAVSSLMETGANDVLVVQGERERLIPFTLDQAVREVDLAAGRIVVDWDPDF